MYRNDFCLTWSNGFFAFLKRFFILPETGFPAFFIPVFGIAVFFSKSASPGFFPEGFPERAACFGVVEKGRACQARQGRGLIGSAAACGGKSGMDRKTAPDVLEATGGVCRPLLSVSGDALSAFCRRFGQAGQASFFQL